MNIFKQSLRSFAFIVVLFTLPTSAFAADTYYYKVQVDVNNGGSTTAWRYQVLTSQTSNPGSTCYAQGEQLNFLNFLNVVEMGLQFTGSESRTRYLTVCDSDSWVTVEMTLSMTSCALWSCRISYEGQVVALSNLTVTSRTQSYESLVNTETMYLHITD